MTLSGSSPVQSRHDFGRDLAAFGAWHDAQKSPEAPEVWGAFSQLLAASFAKQSATIWLCGVHPAHRERLALLFCSAAHAKMRLDPTSHFGLDPLEAQLWSAALSASPRAARLFETQLYESSGEFGWQFAGIQHRLADQFHRAGCCDERALRLYIAVFTGRGALPPSVSCVGAHHRVETLLQRGAEILESTSLQEIGTRYNLCLLLQTRGFRAPWVERSLRIARAVYPGARAKFDLAWDKSGEITKRKKQAPAIAELAWTLAQIAPLVADIEERERELREAELHEFELQEIEAAERAEAERRLAEIELLARQQNEKPKRKRSRKTKTEKFQSPPTATEEMSAFESFDLESLFGNANSMTSSSPISADKPRDKAKKTKNEWDNFSFDFDGE